MGKLSAGVSVDECIQLGNRFFAEGKKHKATQYYQQAIKLQPKLALAWCNAGVALHESGDVARAEKHLKKAIQLDPLYSLAHYNLAMLLYRSKREEAAIPYFESVITLEPTLIGAYNDLGLCLKRQHKLDQAQVIFERALAIDPTAPLVHNNLGNVLRELGEFMHARQRYLIAVALDPNYAEAWGNLGGVDKIAKFPDEGRIALEKAIALKDNVADFYHNLAVIDQDQGRIERAISNFEKAIVLNPELEASYSCLYLAKRQICDWKALARLEKTLDHINNEDPFTTVIRSEDIQKNFMVAKKRSETIAESVTQKGYTFSPKKKKKKIRLGYFSHDLREHPIGQMVAPLFRLHDRKNFEVYTYSYGPKDNSEYRVCAEEGSDMFLDVQQMSNSDIADRIFQDRIDILIDLTGYTMDNRLEVCAMRPAPVQISYLGYPGTTGAKFFDAVIFDKMLVRPEEEKWFTEKVVYLPHCYQINNEDVTPAKTRYTRNMCNLPESGFVFASFNQSFKIEPQLFALWMRILNKVPGSVLWLWKQDPEVEEKLRKEAVKLGVQAKRLVFGERLAKEEHLARLSLADLSLDTLTYGGHTTTTDNLMAGVPVLTRYGTHVASRVCASILHEVGLDNFIVQNLEEYESFAIRLALDPELLQQAKKKLTRAKLEKSILNTARAVTSLEKAYQMVWSTYLESDKQRGADDKN